MNIVSALFKMARLAADIQSVARSAETGSAKPIVRRLTNKAIGRGLVSKMFWRK